MRKLNKRKILLNVIYAISIILMVYWGYLTMTLF